MVNLGSRILDEAQARNTTEGHTTADIKGAENRLKDLELKNAGNNDKREESAAATPCGGSMLTLHIMLDSWPQSMPRRTIEQDSKIWT